MSGVGAINSFPINTNPINSIDLEDGTVTYTHWQTTVVGSAASFLSADYVNFPKPNKLKAKPRNRSMRVYK